MPPADPDFVSDFLIVGSDAAAASAGRRLAEAGHSVLLLDPGREPLAAGRPTITHDELSALSSALGGAGLGPALGRLAGGEPVSEPLWAAPFHASLARAGYRRRDPGPALPLAPARAHLAAARRSGRLKLLRGQPARLLFAGRLVQGLELVDGRKLLVRREVVLADQAPELAKLLLLSGIGPAARLAGLGIAPVADRPGVGAGLAERVYIEVLRSAPGWRGRLGGVFGAGAAECRGLLLPDGPGPVALAYRLRRGALALAPALPMARGRASLAGPDPRLAPRLELDPLGAPQDRAALEAGLRLAATLWGAAAAPLAEAALRPAGWVTGTARMGEADDPRAVADSAGRVIGVAGLRIAGAALLPAPLPIHPEAAGLFIGELIADQLLLRPGTSLRPQSAAKPASQPAIGAAVQPGLRIP